MFLNLENGWRYVDKLSSGRFMSAAVATGKIWIGKRVGERAGLNAVQKGNNSCSCQKC
jgi:hypothetical protein